MTTPTPRRRLPRPAALAGLSKQRHPPLPADFLFGVGTSDHQCEAFDPRYPDVWDDWEAGHRADGAAGPSLTPRGRATDFWDRYPEDVELARSLGCSAFRFSIAWARVEPEPGRFSEEALAHYRTLAETIRAAGMEPVVTLMHFVWPRHVEQRGGLRAPEFPAWFGAYAERVRQALGDLVRYWITINEPNALIFGYLKPFWLARYAWPPGLPSEASDDEQMRASAEVIRHLFLAHRAARRALRAGPGGEGRLVSANTYYLGLPSQLWRFTIPLMRLVDWRAKSEKGWSEEDWVLAEGRLVLHPHLTEQRRTSRVSAGLLKTLGGAVEAALDLLGGAKGFAALFSFIGANWWLLGMRGELPEFLCPPECRGEQDYVAFDYYYGTRYLFRIGSLMDVLLRRYDRAPIWPGGLSQALNYLQGLFPGQPLFVIENGVAGPSSSLKRSVYLWDHLRAIQSARADGVNVIGYLAWSLTTNREWGLPSGPHGDFGLFHIDLDHDEALTRQPTPASQTYEWLVRHRGA